MSDFQTFRSEGQPSVYTPEYTDRAFNVDDIRTVEPVGKFQQLERPTDAVITYLRGYDDRIKAVHAEGDSVWDVLARRLDKDFKGEHTIGMRAVEASLDGLVVSAHGLRTLDIRDVLKLGDIQVRSRVNIAGYKPGAGEGIFHRVQQYGSQTNVHRIEMGSGPDTHRIFPVVLAYNMDVMQRYTGPYGYGLPSTLEDRARAIRAAYVLDATVGRQYLQ